MDANSIFTVEPGMRIVVVLSGLAAGAALGFATAGFGFGLGLGVWAMEGMAVPHDNMMAIAKYATAALPVDAQQSMEKRTMRFTLTRTFPLLICGILLNSAKPSSCADDLSLSRFQYTQYHMGVQVRIVVYAPDEATAVDACEAAYKRFAELDTMMSDYRADSELNLLCAKAGGPPVRVSKDLHAVLKRSIEIAKKSDGAFDPTVGPVVALWRKARKTSEMPDPQELEKARKLVGWKHIRLNDRNRTVQLMVPGMKLDLGGIAKGYADDCAQKVLKSHGITRALVEAGGDIVVSDPPVGASGWRIEVDNASPGPKKTILEFSNCAVSTSGDTEQYVEIGGKRYSHIVDPRTGLGLTSRMAVTVAARDGITSDSLSTAMSVLGEERGRSLAKTYGVSAVYIRRAE